MTRSSVHPFLDVCRSSAPTASNKAEIKGTHSGSMMKQKAVAKCYAMHASNQRGKGLGLQATTRPHMQGTSAGDIACLSIPREDRADRDPQCPPHPSSLCRL
ncbi:hypothetical protein SEVIR_3G130932v4 [Setaria viridis]|uniref:Uncharacterized protein n=1 Tax=Setaria viridis TaxID=4556 RepID=A0A4V6D9E0_SETVI|nr:hypothetical protein SEVIR_3G130932v2 [Setaria viridis]